NQPGDSWAGETVMPKKPNVKFGARVDDKEQYYRLVGTVFPVLRENGDWIRLRSVNGKEAWAEKSDFVLVRDATTFYTELIRTDAKNSWAWHQRGIAWNYQGEYDNAIKDYTECLLLEPLDAVAFNNRGNAWHNKKDHAKAITDYNEAIRIDPKFALAFNNRGHPHP